MYNRNSKIITIGNTKGGCGKSTFAVLLSQYLTLKNHWINDHVCILDLDAPQYTTYTFFKHRKKYFTDAITPSVINYDISKETYPYTELRQYLESLKEKYNYIIIDSGGHHDTITKFSIEVADYLITPVIPTIIDLNVLFSYDMENDNIIEGSYTKFVRSAKNKYKKLTWFVIPNRCNPIVTEYSKQCLNILKAMSDLIGFRITSHMVDRSIYSQLFDLGLTCFDDNIDEYIPVSNMALLNARREVIEVIDMITSHNR